MAKIKVQSGWSVLYRATKEAAAEPSLETSGVSFLHVEENGKRSRVTANTMTLSDLFSIFFP